MENREKIVAEYFKLRVLLNKANLVSNEKTEVEFRIESSGSERRRLLAILIGKNGQRSNLEICSLVARRWTPSSFTGFHFFEEFCAKFLNTRSLGDTQDDFKDRVNQLKIELRSLGIPK